MNHLTLIGHIGSNPELTKFESGSKLARFSLAVKEYSQGREPQTIWVTCECWGGLADRAIEYVTQGKQVAVHGRLAISTYTKKVAGQDVKMSRPFVKMTSFELLGKKPEAEVEIEELDEESYQSQVKEPAPKARKSRFKLSDQKAS